MYQFELPSASREEDVFDLDSQQNLHQLALSGSGKSVKRVGNRSPKVDIRHDTEKGGQNIIVKTDKLKKVYYNEYIFQYLEYKFFKTNWSESSLGDFVGLTVEVGKKVYTGKIRFYKKLDYYLVSIDQLSSDYADVDFSSDNQRDWLTESGLVQFEAMVDHFSRKGAMSVSEMIAPEGMVILLEYQQIYYLIDSNKVLRISYHDFLSAISSDKDSYRQVRIKQFSERTHRRLSQDKKVRIYIIPEDRRIQKNPDFQEGIDNEKVVDEGEQLKEEPEFELAPSSKHIEINFSRAIKPGYYFRVLKEDQRGDRVYEGEKMVLLLSLFEKKDQELYKKPSNKYLRKYVYNQVNGEQMARAITHFDPSLFTLTHKLQYIQASHWHWNINIHTVRPILAQYPNSKKLSAKYSKWKYRKDSNVNLNQLIKDSQFTLKYTPPQYSTGNFDDVLDTSYGIVGIDDEDAQSRLVRLKDLDQLDKLWRKQKQMRKGEIPFDQEKYDEAEYKKKYVHETYGLTNEMSSGFAFSGDMNWYKRFFRDNAVKLSFEILNKAEEFILQEMRNYHGNKYYQLERDFLEYQEPLESLAEAAGIEVHPNPSERRRSQSILDGAAVKDVEPLIAFKHPFLLDINQRNGNYSDMKNLGRLYAMYKRKPASFRSYFLRKMHASISDRLSYINETKQNLRSDPKFVWELESVIGMTRNLLHQDSNEIYDRIIRRVLKRNKEDKLRRSIGLAIGAVVLGLVSFGIGTALFGVAGGVLATTYALGGISLSAVDIYERYHRDKAVKDAYNIGNEYTPFGALTQKDPELGWFVLEIGALGLDLGALISVYRAVSPVAKLASKSDEVIDVGLDLKAVLKELTEQTDGLKKVHAVSIEKKILAQQELRDARRAFSGIASSKAAANPFADPEIWIAFRKVMLAYLKTGVKNSDELIKRLILDRKLGKLKSDIDFSKLTLDERELLDRFVDDWSYIIKSFAEVDDGLVDAWKVLSDANIPSSILRDSNFLKRFKDTEIPDASLKHANDGDFTFDLKTKLPSRMKGGGHGQRNIELLEEYGFEYNIVKTYDNGVRIGNVPLHKVKWKRAGTGQSWFPESWTDLDIENAGKYVSSLSENLNAVDGQIITGTYKGVVVGVQKTNGKVGTIFADSVQ